MFLDVCHQAHLSQRFSTFTYLVQKLVFLILILCISELQAAPTTRQNKTTASVMATLSIIALRINDGADANWVKHTLADTELATAGQWALQWFGKNDLEGTGMVGFSSLSEPSAYAIAIKGQNASNPVDLIHGINVIWMDRWPYSPESGRKLKVSAGAKLYIDNLLSLKGDSEDKTQHQSVVQWFEDLLDQHKPTQTTPLTLYVTGDSLGGSGAVLLGVYLHSLLKAKQLQAGSVRMGIYVTNPPALYDQEFVDFYNGLTTDQEIPVTQLMTRLERDIVSGYIAYNIAGITSDIQPASLPLTTVMSVVTKSIVSMMKLGGLSYSQIGNIKTGTRRDIPNLASKDPFHLPEELKGAQDLKHFYEYEHFSGPLLTSLGVKIVPCPNNKCSDQPNSPAKLLDTLLLLQKQLKDRFGYMSQFEDGNQL